VFHGRFRRGFHQKAPKKQHAEYSQMIPIGENTQIRAGFSIEIAEFHVVVVTHGDDW
jgi:hypothetical protein